MANREVKDTGTERTVEEVSGDDDVKYRSTKKGGAKFPWQFPIRFGAETNLRTVEEV